VTVGPLQPGSQQDIGDGAMLVHAFAVHAVLIQFASGPIPCIMLDVAGNTDTGDQQRRLLVPDQLASELLPAIARALDQLDALRTPPA